MMRGIIFDVDGVIADTEAVNAEASIAMFADEFGIQGVARADFSEGVGRGAAAYVQAAARCHGRELTATEVARATEVRQTYFLQILRERPLPAFPGVLELIEAALANASSYKLAIATSSTREKSGAVLASAGIPVHRMVYVCGDDVTHKKPDPELFLTASARLNLDPKVCVVVEDAPNGIAAAKAAGACGIGVTNSFPEEALTGANLVVASLDQVSLDVIDSLCA